MRLQQFADQAADAAEADDDHRPVRLFRRRGALWRGRAVGGLGARQPLAQQGQKRDIQDHLNSVEKGQHGGPEHRKFKRPIQARQALGKPDTTA